MKWPEVEKSIKTDLATATLCLDSALLRSKWPKQAHLLRIIGIISARPGFWLRQRLAPCPGKQELYNALHEKESQVDVNCRKDDNVEPRCDPSWRYIISHGRTGTTREVLASSEGTASPMRG